MDDNAKWAEYFKTKELRHIRKYLSKYVWFDILDRNYPCRLKMCNVDLSSKSYVEFLTTNSKLWVLSFAYDYHVFEHDLWYWTLK